MYIYKIVVTSFNHFQYKILNTHSYVSYTNRSSRYGHDGLNAKYTNIYFNTTCNIRMYMYSYADIGNI